MNRKQNNWKSLSVYWMNETSFFSLRQNTKKMWFYTRRRHYNWTQSFCWLCLWIRVTVGLGWTRARASNPRVGQGWTYPSRPSGSDGLGFLSERVGRIGVFVRAGYSGSDFCPTNWIGQAYLFVGHSIRISAHTKISSWALKPWVEQSILSDGLSWTSNFVRRIDLGIKFCSSPSSELARVSWS
jgi:hypothetical protein